MTERIEALDALRGLAALVVLSSHLFITFPAAIAPIDIFSGASWSEPWTWLRYTPLRALVSGRPAVILFFVLSGFVLALGFLPNAKHNTATFLWRRFWRIYMPAAASSILAGALATLFQSWPTLGLSDWFTGASWTQPVTPDMLARHLLLTGLPADNTLNNVIWSLVHELRISLIFPLLMLLLRSSSLRAAVAAIALVLLSNLLLALSQPDTILHSWLTTLTYVPFFIAGALLAKHRGAITDRFAHLSSNTTATVLLVSISLCALPPSIPLAELAYAIAATAFIGIALGTPVTKSTLSAPSLQWLGRVSFSLYLFHLPVLLVVFRLLNGRVDPWLIVAIVIAISLVAADLGYRFVERPAMAIGRRQFRGGANPV